MICLVSSGSRLVSGIEQIQRFVKWAVPDIPSEQSGKDVIHQEYSPLFSSTEVHSNYVDRLCCSTRLKRNAHHHLTATPAFNFGVI